MRSPRRSTAAIGPIRRSDRKKYHAHIVAAARAFALEPALIHAVISAESGYNPLARSPKGAKGLMQLMPDTAKRYGVDNPLDPEQNIQGGAAYLRDLLKLFGNDLNLALAAYNAGEGTRDRVRQHPAVPRDQAVRAEGAVVLQEVQDDDVTVRRSVISESVISKTWRSADRRSAQIAVDPFRSLRSPDHRSLITDH